MARYQNTLVPCDTDIQTTDDSPNGQHTTNAMRLEKRSSQPASLRTTDQPMIEVSESTTDSIELVLTAPSKAVFFYRVEMRSCCADEWTALPVRLRADGNGPVKVWVDRLNHGQTTFRVIANYEDSTVAVGGSSIHFAPHRLRQRCYQYPVQHHSRWLSVLGAVAARIAAAQHHTSGWRGTGLTDQQDIEDIAVHIDHINKYVVSGATNCARSTTQRQAPDDVITGIPQRTCKHKEATKGTRHQHSSNRAGHRRADWQGQRTRHINMHCTVSL